LHLERQAHQRELVDPARESSSRFTFSMMYTPPPTSRTTCPGSVHLSSGSRWLGRSQESLLSWNPEALASEYTLPILVAHGEDNDLSPLSEALSLYRKWNGEKSLYRIVGAGHTDWMHDDNQHFIALAEAIGNWLDKYTRGS
jgi:fermentation-respiration switch protein FrsA (DUF1100 family)